MLLIHGLNNLSKKFPSQSNNGCVATIGNYDGIHLGHKKILEHLVQKAKELNSKSIVISFEPQPGEFFAKKNSEKNSLVRLTSLREKIHILSKIGIDYILILPFNNKLANMSAVYFIEEVLLRILRTHYIIIGDDFCFGYQCEGNVTLLHKYSKHPNNLHTYSIPAVKLNGVRISSSFIRNALIQNKLNIAKKFLGRPYSITGRVIHGMSLGKNIGFPTANVWLPKRNLCFSGVYAVLVYSSQTTKPLRGIANIGFCPTFPKKQQKNKSLEVYIFDFKQNIYGKIISLEFYKKIRDEQKFLSIKELNIQIKQDITEAKVFFTNTSFL